jgi:hypothetical protein
MFRPLIPLLTSLLLLGALVLNAAEPAPLKTLAGEIEGARWAALVPENWDGRLLLQAPDRRQAADPLVANLDSADPATDKLLAAGWAIATTSYRRHGPLIEDGVTDLRALRDLLAEELGQPKLTLVEGTGMGGLIALFIAERHADEFHGCIALDPPMDLRDPRALRLRYDHQPRAPLLLLATPADVDPVQAYVARARTMANAESARPVFWFVPTDPMAAGAAPQEEALATMEEWVRTGRQPADRPPPEPEAPAKADSSEVPAREPVAEGEGGGATVHVSEAPAAAPAEPSSAPPPPDVTAKP